MIRPRAKLLCTDGIALLKCADEDGYEIRFVERLPKPRFYELRRFLAEWFPRLFPSSFRIYAFRLSAADARRLGHK